MGMNAKLVWGLAWAGLALVVAVPSADFLTGKFGASAAVVTSTTDPVETGSVTTTRTANGIIITPAGSNATSTDAVDSYIKSGKKLPSYVTDDTVAAPTPTTQVASVDTTAVATPAPVVAPQPFPSWARPRASKPAPAQPTVIVDELTIGSTDDDVVVVDPPTSVATAGPVPPANIPERNNWTEPGLEDYLDQNGLLDDSRSTATVTQTDPVQEAQSNSNYDPDGFYLSDGPNGDRSAAERRRARLRELFGDDYTDNSDDDGDFSLF